MLDQQEKTFNLRGGGGGTGCSLRRSSPAEVSLQAGSEPKLSVPGEKPRWQEWQVHAASDGDSQKCCQGSLGVSTHIMLINILPSGSLSSIMPVIAEASSCPFVLPVKSFKFCSDAVSKSGD